MMKKLLLILVIGFIGVGLFAQEKTSGGTVQPFTDRDIDHSDSILILLGRIAILEGYTVDTTAPILSRGNVYESDPGIWIFNFSEDMAETDNDSILYGLSLTENGAAVTPDSFNITESSMNVYTPSVTSGSTLKVSWEEKVSGGLRDSIGNKLRTFVDSTVTVFNNATYSIPAMFWYAFNGNYIDQQGGYSATPTGQATFPSAPGDSVLIFSGTSGEDYITIIDPGFTSDVISFSWREFQAEDVASVWYVGSNGNDGASASGWSIKLEGDGTDDYRYFIRSGDGTTSSFKSGTYGDISEDTWHDIVLILYASTGGVKYYVDGVLKLDETFSISPIDITGNIRWGNRYPVVGGRDNNAMNDELRAYDYELTTALIDSLDTNPFRLPFTTDGGGYVASSDSIFDFHAQSSFRYVEQSYTYAMALSDFNAEYGRTPYQSEIVIVSGDTALRLNAAEGTHGADWDLYWPTGGGEDEYYYTWDMDISSPLIIYPSVFPWSTCPDPDRYLTDSDYGLKLPGFGGLGTDNKYNLRTSSSQPLDTDNGNEVRGRIDKSGGWLGSYYYSYVDYRQTASTGQVLGTFAIDGSGEATLTGFPRVNYTIRAAMNDVGQANGVLNLYIDGVCVYADNTMEWRGDPSIDFDMVRNKFYFGGCGIADQDEYMNMYNFAIYKYTQDAIDDATNYPTVKSRNIANTPGEQIPLPSITFMHE